MEDEDLKYIQNLKNHVIWMIEKNRAENPDSTDKELREEIAAKMNECGAQASEGWVATFQYKDPEVCAAAAWQRVRALERAVGDHESRITVLKGLREHKEEMRRLREFLEIG